MTERDREKQTDRETDRYTETETDRENEDRERLRERALCTLMCPSCILTLASSNRGQQTKSQLQVQREGQRPPGPFL